MTTVAGTPVPVSVRANGTNTGVDVTGTGFTLQVSAQTPGGSSTPLGASGSVRLDQGGTVRTDGSGFQAGGSVRVYVLSTPVLLGTLTANASGDFAGSLPVPTTLAPGAHTLQVNGYTASGQVRSISLGIQVVAPSAAAGPRTLGTRVIFAYESSALTLNARRSLRALVRQVGESGTPRSIVVGVVRSVGAKRTDIALARSRAARVTNYLRAIGLEGVIVTKVAKAPVTNTYQSRRVNVSVTVQGG